MPQVRITPGTGNGNAFHRVAVVFNEFDVFFRDRSPETGPACAGFEFRIGIKQCRTAAGTAEDALIVQVPVLTGKRRLRAFMARDRKGLGRKLLLPLVLALHHLGYSGTSLALAGFGELHNIYFLSTLAARLSLRSLSILHM